MSEREELEKRLDQYKGRWLKMTDRGWQPVDEEPDTWLNAISWVCLWGLVIGCIAYGVLQTAAVLNPCGCH